MLSSARVFLLFISILNADTFTKNGTHGYPTVDSPAIISYLKAFALNRFYKEKIFAPVHFAEHNIANLQLCFSNRFDGTKLSRFDFAIHRISARAKRNGFTIFEFFVID